METSSTTSTSSSSNTTVTSTPVPMNGLTRSRRSHFSRKDSTPEMNKEKETKEQTTTERIVHEYERLLCYSKSPHSLALPRDWSKISEKHPWLVKNKVKFINFNNNNNCNGNGCNKNNIMHRGLATYKSFDTPCISERLNRYSRSLSFTE